MTDPRLNKRGFPLGESFKKHGGTTATLVNLLAPTSL